MQPQTNAAKAPLYFAQRLDLACTQQLPPAESAVLAHVAFRNASHMDAEAVTPWRPHDCYCQKLAELEARPLATMTLRARR